MEVTKPYVIELKKFSDKGGDLSILEKEVPFEIKRIYWLYHVKGQVTRGGHAHTNTERVIICLNKSIKVVLTDQNQRQYSFDLSSPNQALYYPSMYWVDLYCQEDAIMLAAASTTYEEDEYIRSFDEFIKR